MQVLRTRNTLGDRIPCPPEHHQPRPQIREHCLDMDGHVKVTDLNLSKDGISDNYGATFKCGTPEYLITQILDKQCNGKAVGWYPLGALVFDVLKGLTPFNKKGRSQLSERIHQGADLLEFIAHPQPPASSKTQRATTSRFFAMTTTTNTITINTNIQKNKKATNTTENTNSRNTTRRQTAPRRPNYDPM